MQKYLVLNICHVLNSNTPPPPTVTFSVILQYPPPSPLFEHVFFERPLRQEWATLLTLQAKPYIFLIEAGHIGMILGHFYDIFVLLFKI
jgi:hypothetical protein